MREFNVCEMCLEYNKSEPCDHEVTCKLKTIMKENKRLKKENERLHSELRYANSNIIGDNHEMGAW